MKLRKRNFIIIKTDNGRYNIALRTHPNHPLDEYGFDTKKDARKRLNDFIRKANKYIKEL